MRLADHHLPRRTFLGLCGLAGSGALFATAAGCGPGGMGGDTGPEVVPEGLGTLPIPPMLEGELQGGVRVFTLALRRGTREWIRGVATATFGVDGPFLGPTLRLRRGERVRIEVKNELGVTSSLHWHGVELPARADGGPYQPIAPAASWASEFDVVQGPMTAWYHPHPMHETARQVYMGMAGVLVIDDPAAPAGVLPSTYGVDDLPLVLQDRRLAPDGSHPYSEGRSLAMRDQMAGLKGQTILVNGAVRPRAVVPKGLVRLRVLNGSNARNYHLGFADGRRFWIVAGDGGWLEAPVETARALVAPGERVELLVDFGADASSSSVLLRSFSGEVAGALFRGMMGTNLADGLDRGTFDVMTFQVGVAAERPLARPTALPPVERLAPASAIRTRRIVLSMTMGMGGGMGGGGGMGVALNGQTMMDLVNVPPEIDFRIPAGDTEIWELVNESDMAHPVHVHHRHFTIVDMNGAPPPPELAGWKDTVLVRPGQVVRVLLRFVGTPDATLPYLFHCHILEHEDMGMMGRFFLV